MKKILLFLFLIDIVVIATVFLYSGIFNDGIDTAVYVSQIQSFTHVDVIVDNTASSFRLFKPFYGIVGAILTICFSPYVAILLINLSFLVGLTLLAYFFFKKIGNNQSLSIAGAIWVAMSYPMLKYGIALGTDISGWFFTTATIVMFLYAVEKDNWKYVSAASLIGLLGSFTKETGVMGLIFCGVFILLNIGVWSHKKVLQWLLALCVPFFLSQGIFMLIMHYIGAPSFLEWYAFNQDGYAENYYKLKYFLGSEGSTFNILLPFSLIGLWMAIKTKDILKRDWISKYGALFIASLPVLLWPIFISRVLFIQFIFIIPLALYGIDAIYKKNRRFALSLCVLPPLVSLGLFFLSGKGSLFVLLQSLL